MLAHDRNGLSSVGCHADRNSPRAFGLSPRRQGVRQLQRANAGVGRPPVRDLAEFVVEKVPIEPKIASDEHGSINESGDIAGDLRKDRGGLDIGASDSVDVRGPNVAPRIHEGRVLLDRHPVFEAHNRSQQFGRFVSERTRSSPRPQLRTE